MSLTSDISEAKKLWKESSWILRCTIVLSVFLTTSSITSMSDAIVGWRGFILDGLLFYRNWITSPVEALFALVYLDGISQQEIDIAIIITIPLIAEIRMKNEQVISLKKWYLLMPLLWVFSSSLSHEAAFDFMDRAIQFVYLSLLFCMGWFTYLTDKQNFVRGFGPIVLSVVLVLLLASISSGLTREI